MRQESRRRRQIQVVHGCFKVLDPPGRQAGGDCVYGGNASVPPLGSVNTGWPGNSLVLDSNAVWLLVYTRKSSLCVLCLVFYATAPTRT